MVVQEEQRDELTAERVAKNDALFRESNEQLVGVARALEFTQDEALPFLCECADVKHHDRPASRLTPGEAPPPPTQPRGYLPPT